MKNYPETIVVMASAAWGLFWIPLRAFERAGLAPGWATLLQFLVPLLLLLPVAVWRRRTVVGRQARSGTLIGVAVALYLASLLLTDVARALILFYAMPAWGTLLEVGVLKRPLTKWRVTSLLLSVAGLLIILGSGQSLRLSINVGDGLALLSGMVFAIGALQVRRLEGETAVFNQLLGFFFSGSVAALILSQLPIAALGNAPTIAQLLTLTPWLLLMAVGFFIPTMWGIYWGSRQVDPGRLGILLQMEAVVGIGSAALLAGEPFGMRQAVGAVLVIGAGVVELVGNRSKGEPSVPDFGEVRRF